MTKFHPCFAPGGQETFCTLGNLSAHQQTPSSSHWKNSLPTLTQNSLPNSSALLFSPLPRNNTQLFASLLEKLELLQEHTLSLRVACASNCLFLAEQRGQFQQKGKGQPPAQRSSPAHCGHGWAKLVLQFNVDGTCVKRGCLLLDANAQRGKKNPQRADTRMVFSTTAEHFVKTLGNKKKEELLATFSTLVWLVRQSPGAVPCILEHHLLAFCLLTCYLHENMASSELS